MSAKQRTIAAPTRLEGIGLHTGENVRIELKPAECGDGIYFVRMDIPEKPVVEALVENVVETDRGTVLEKDGVKVHTVEHLLGVVWGMGIDNLRIELWGAEPPALDGSGLGFAEAIESVGILELEAEAPVISPDEPFRMSFDDREIILLPSKELKVSFGVDYPHPVLSTQFISIPINQETILKEISPARTYVFKADLEEIWAKGLAKGGSLENAIVIDDKGYINGPLRFPNEPVRHKVLDLLGDLALVGKRIEGHIIAIKTGHKHHIEFVKHLKNALGGDAFSIHDVLNIMPHRYPFLLVDRIVSLSEDYVVGIKNVTYNEPFFQGHFPDDPIMPGVLIVEAMAQVGGFLLLHRVEDKENKLLYFSGIDDVRFKRPVRPGDRIRFELRLIRFGGRIAKMAGVAKVGGEIAVSATLTAAIVEKPKAKSS